MVIAENFSGSPNVNVSWRTSPAITLTFLVTRYVTGNNVVESNCLGIIDLPVGSAKSTSSVVLNDTTFGACVKTVEFLSIFKKYVASGI